MKMSVEERAGKKNSERVEIQSDFKEVPRWDMDVSLRMHRKAFYT